MRETQTTIIGRYQVLRSLGEGATSRVYLAADPKMDRQVAIKVLAKDADEEIRRRFRLEAKSIAALHHPNIVELYDYSGPDAADLFRVMEYVSGPSLYAFTKKHGLMSEAAALCVGHELCFALEHAHARGVVHRDLKPENVLLQDGRVVLTDFGAVKAFSRQNPLGVKDVAGQTRTLGTPGFMSPEQFQGRDIDQRSDLFALGAVLYNLTTDRLAYEGAGVDATYRNLKSGRYVDPRQHHRLLSPEFCTLLATCLAPNPKDRIDRADRLRERILELLHTHGVTEVRKELQRYQQQPAQEAVGQRERQLDALIREIKLALRNKDVGRAKELAERFEAVAPLDERLRQLSGGAMQPMLTMAEAKRQRRWAMLVGILIGLVLGGLAGWLG
jgi:serine/threonine-protein kinase